MDVGTYEVKNKLSAILDRVEKGENFTITRRGKAVARLVPATERDRKQAIKAMNSIIARSKSVTLGGLKIKDLVSEGRV
ncbi:MAG TPA: type II toxin-antitoxin system prevent-host-death family antitoxin [Alphaproteobacteria bacterium]|nr:type II toxin-antitoxin system prevent-host-death family antitoxin [Alphaproteobacteria bacterium]